MFEIGTVICLALALTLFLELLDASKWNYYDNRRGGHILYIIFFIGLAIFFYEQIHFVYWF